jgi:hypothetical protein
MDGVAALFPRGCSRAAGWYAVAAANGRNSRIIGAMQAASFLSSVGVRSYFKLRIEAAVLIAPVVLVSYQSHKKYV